MIDKSSPLPLYIQLKEHLMEKIVSGEYPLGAQLPTEKELTDSLGLGRATVRAAFSELERSGAIVKRHGVGSFVSYSAKKNGFAPLISLSYTLDVMGVKSVSELAFNKAVMVEGGELAQGWEKGKTVRLLRRVRRAEKLAVAIEDDYIAEPYFSAIANEDFSGSLTQLLLEKAALDVGKIEQTVVLRVPSEEEQKILGAQKSTELLEMKRWLYARGGTEPVTFVRFVVPYDLMQVPYEIYRRNFVK